MVKKSQLESEKGVFGVCTGTGEKSAKSGGRGPGGVGDVFGSRWWHLGGEVEKVEKLRKSGLVFLSGGSDCDWQMG